METNSGFEARRVGFVLGVASRLGRGRCFPADLVKACLRSAGRSAIRRRLSAEFRGYLVSEAGPVVPLFSKHRAAHEYGILPECVSGGGSLGYRRDGYADEAGGPLDAPGFVPSGAMRSAEFGGFSGVVDRAKLRGGEAGGAWFAGELGEGPFSRRRWFHHFDSLGKTGVDIAAPRSWQAWVTYDVVGAIDAPEYIAAGGVGVLVVIDSGQILTKCAYSQRDGR